MSWAACVRYDVSVRRCSFCTVWCCERSYVAEKAQLVKTEDGKAGCILCTEGMNCTLANSTKATLSLLPDYWRANRDTLTIIKCRLDGACVGGSILVDNPATMCRAHHRGELCEVGVEFVLLRLPVLSSPCLFITHTHTPSLSVSSLSLAVLLRSILCVTSSRVCLLCTLELPLARAVTSRIAVSPTHASCSNASRGTVSRAASARSATRRAT